MKLAFSVKLEIECLCLWFMLKMRIRQNLGCPNKEYKPIPEVN